MKKFLLTFLITFTVMVLPGLVIDASAQPPPPPPQAIPIDGGLTLLIIAGAAYGARRIYKHSKEEKE